MTKKTTKTGPQSRPDPYALDRVPKPDFVHLCMENQTFYRVPGVIPAADRQALIDALPKRLNDAMKALFVDAVLLDAEFCLAARPNQSGQSYVTQLREIKDKARALLVALARIEPDAMGIFAMNGGDVGANSNDPKIGRTSPFTQTLFAPTLLAPPGYELDQIWDVVQDVELIAHIAAERLHLQKGKRPDEFLSKAIAWMAARHFKDMFSKAPPLTEMGWFAVWLSDLGGKLRHPFSAKQAATGLKRWQANQAPTGKVPS